MTHFGRFLYGGDYNPDQWLDRPDILDEDIRLMRLASVNCVSLGIFSWASLEPKEGVFQFEWLDDVFDRLHNADISINLGTPSGAKPNWMARQYPEIRRVDISGAREPQHVRHNHCWTSPVYRDKVQIINRMLSERYGNHPAVILWHLSNEYGGDCYCDLCYASFRDWLRTRYGTLDALNKAYWSTFWSSTISDWDEINFIDQHVHCLKLDWQRFTSLNCVDFIKNEIAAIRAGGSDRPVTTNMMCYYTGLNYWDQVSVLDYISEDAYPRFHLDVPDTDIACDTAFAYDLARAMKQGQPWLLMESTPSVVNWGPVSRPKKPGMARLSALQAIAHGSTSVMYFQWRKCRGSWEKFHGAVVDHVGHEYTRCFKDVASLGAELATIPQIADTCGSADTAIIYDWDVRWSLDNSTGPRNVDKCYYETSLSFYKPLWRNGVAVDVIDSLQDFSTYRIIIAPMLYMVRPGVAERLRHFVESGGTLVGTYLSGLVNESDLCFSNGFPGPLRELFGVWAEETDVPGTFLHQSIVPVAGNLLGLTQQYSARHYCDVIHAEGAETLACYGTDYYAGSPACTVNRFGDGQAFYIASRNDESFQADFIEGILRHHNISGVLRYKLPDGVSVTSRYGEGWRYLFIMNFNPTPINIFLHSAYERVQDGTTISGNIILQGYGCDILKESFDPSIVKPEEIK